MTSEEIILAIKDIIQTIAPDEDLSELKTDVRLRDQIELDSMDFLRFVTLLQAEHGVEVPESDYRKVGTLDGCAAWIAAHVPAEQP